LIVGSTSYGKGSVQAVLPLEHNHALKLTTALYFTPSGRSIQAKGINPDLQFDADTPTDDSNTAILAEAVRQLKDRHRA
jgi:carboxyl-terminal processing protease